MDLILVLFGSFLVHKPLSALIQMEEAPEFLSNWTGRLKFICLNFSRAQMSFHTCWTIHPDYSWNPTLVQIKGVKKYDLGLELSGSQDFIVVCDGNSLCVKSNSGHVKNTHRVVYAELLKQHFISTHRLTVFRVISVICQSRIIMYQTFVIAEVKEIKVEHWWIRRGLQFTCVCWNQTCLEEKGAQEMLKTIAPVQLSAAVSDSHNKNDDPPPWPIQSPEEIFT